jgi:hypothetical protein
MTRRTKGESLAGGGHVWWAGTLIVENLSVENSLSSIIKIALKFCERQSFFGMAAP